MASKGYDFVLTETAETDIDDAFMYISETLGNPDAASDLADGLEKQIDKICKRPLTGKLVENDYLRRPDVRRFLVDNYIAYYIIDEIVLVTSPICRSLDLVRIWNLYYEKNPSHS